MYILLKNFSKLIIKTIIVDTVIGRPYFKTYFLICVYWNMAKSVL